MALSEEILSCLSWFDEVGYSFVWEDLRELIPLPDDLTDEERADRIRGAKILHEVMKLIVEERKAPVPGSRNSLESIVDVGGDKRIDRLNAYFTVLNLRQVPQYVQRWGKLRRVHVHASPEPRVAAYFLQATSAYVLGLFDAVAILSRSVIQFSLEEHLSQFAPELALVKSQRKDYLYNLIDLAYKKDILGFELKGVAHTVRERGNGASHEKPCDEAEALCAIEQTRRVLLHLYRNRKAR